MAMTHHAPGSPNSDYPIPDGTFSDAPPHARWNSLGGARLRMELCGSLSRDDPGDAGRQHGLLRGARR